MASDQPKSVKDLARQVKNELKFTEEVRGHTFEKGYGLKEFIESYSNIGFQGTNLHRGIEEIKKMKGSKIFLGCTSNIITSGLRDTIKFLVANKHVSVFVTTAGGIEEDLMKTLSPTLLASFDIKGKYLRENGFNRVGNLVIPNDNYLKFEEFLTKVVDELTEGYSSENPRVLTPSSLIRILGKKINNENSILYWAEKNEIPVYCPAITDGSIGDILTFHEKRESLKLDIVEDIYNINSEVFHQKRTGAIVIGGGVVKHHILNANLFKNGLNYCVLLNTANEYDGSDAGANIEEAVSWGKVLPDNTCVKIFGDATIVFPLLVAGAFCE